ncbi:hypothetical protein VTK26DRAFT_3960 [Humicola hyalothermophila]
MFFRSESVPFQPDKDIPPLTGKVILVTGANAGLGKQAVLEFARHKPQQIWLAARSVEKATAAADEIRKHVPDAPITVLQLDLASFASIKAAAATVLASPAQRLDILMLNAGIMAVPHGRTADDYEIQFGTNHMGHALLTKLLLPLLTKTAAEGGPNADVRIVSLSSDAHTFLERGGLDLTTVKGTDGAPRSPFPLYSQSKLANALWARQLAKEYPQFTVAAVHPGVVQTQLLEATQVPEFLKALARGVVGRLILTSVEQGVRNQLWAAVAPKETIKSGEYYVPVGVAGRASEDGQNDELAKKLWDWTENELKEHCV